MREGKGNPGSYSLTLWLSSWKEKSTSGQSTLVVFLYSISDNPRQKMTKDLKDINLGGSMQIVTYR